MHYINIYRLFRSIQTFAYRQGTVEQFSLMPNTVTKTAGGKKTENTKRHLKNIGKPEKTAMGFWKIQNRCYLISFILSKQHVWAPLCAWHLPGTGNSVYQQTDKDFALRQFVVQLKETIISQITATKL